jgi:hypothetical protein
MNREHVGRSGPLPTVSSRWLAPIAEDDATILAALVLAESFEEPEAERLGRPSTDAWDVAIAGLVMGMTGASARDLAVRLPGFSHKTLSRRMADDLFPLLRRTFEASTRLASCTGARDVVRVQALQPMLPQLVARVGIGRARRRNEHGLLVDALIRSIGVNMKIYGDCLGIVVIPGGVACTDAAPAYLEL